VKLKLSDEGVGRKPERPRCLRLYVGLTLSGKVTLADIEQLAAKDARTMSAWIELALRRAIEEAKRKK
jgi:hypothetical protein